MSISYKQESLSCVESDIKPLLEKHWSEVALNQDNIKLNPDWDAYYSLESNGKFKMFTARDADGVLVGYFAVCVATNIHYKDHLFAANDVIYLSPDHRGGDTAIKLITFAKKCLKEDGVSVLTINTKVHLPFDRLMDHLGFSLIERVYSTYLGD